SDPGNPAWVHEGAHKTTPGQPRVHGRPFRCWRLGLAVGTPTRPTMPTSDRVGMAPVIEIGGRRSFSPPPSSLSALDRVALLRPGLEPALHVDDLETGPLQDAGRDRRTGSAQA